jgi:ferredoxin
MRILFDVARCQGHNRCVDIAPEAFAANDDGHADLLLDGGAVPPEIAAKVNLAVLNRPERAITAVDDEKGQP